MTTTYQKSVIFLLKHDPFSVLYDKSGNLEQWDLERKVLVVDLDETLYSINTFHYFIKFILFQALKQFNIALFGFISYVCFLRVFKVL